MRAARLMGAAEALRENQGGMLSPRERALQDCETDALRAALGPAALGRVWAEGRSLTMEQAVTLALGHRQRTTGTSP